MVSTVFLNSILDKRNLWLHIIVEKMISSVHFQKISREGNMHLFRIRLREILFDFDSIPIGTNTLEKELQEGEQHTHTTRRCRRPAHNVRFPFDQFCTSNVFCVFSSRNTYSKIMRISENANKLNSKFKAMKLRRVFASRRLKLQSDK